MALRRRTHRTIILLATTVGLCSLTAAVLLHADWNRARPWLNVRVSDALGRPFAINGDLTLTWERAGGAAGEPAGQGWRGAIPWPRLTARDVHLGNPPALMPAPGAGAVPAEMASAGVLSFSLNPLALLGRGIVIAELRCEAPLVSLWRRADGGNNWTFPPRVATRWTLELQRVVFSKGRVHLSDGVRRAELTADIDSIAAPPYGVAWRLSGKLNGETVSGDGKAGAVLSLQHQDMPFPINAQLRVGPTAITAEGTLTRPTDLAALDMRLKVSGVSMARLYPLTGIVLPETPPFHTEGHLLGTLAAGHWIYERFSGRVGSSDIGGKLDLRTRQPRPELSGTVSSRVLRFGDLAPLIGADSNASKTARGAAPAQPKGKVLPVEAFRTERWTSVDADIEYSAERVVRERAPQIDQLRTHLLLKDGVLTLAPLNFNIAGGALTSTIRLDGGGRVGRRAIQAELKASARHLKLKQLFPALQALRASVGEINGDAALSATGDSVASLLAASNGELKTLINQGTVSKLLLEEMGLNLGNVVLTRLFGDRQVQLNCMATDFVIRQGVMHTRSFIVDTDDALLTVSGDISLANERLDLTLRPDSKGLRVFTLRAPLYVRGTFQHPDVSVDKGVLALRAGTALGLAALAPLAALLPLINTGPGRDSACAALLADARVKPVAPAARH